MICAVCPNTGSQNQSAIIAAAGWKNGRTRDPLDAAVLVNGLAVFISEQIGNQINCIAAKCAGYFWEGAATHKCLLWRVKSSVGQKRNPD
jgi:hypothetical protein